MRANNFVRGLFGVALVWACNPTAVRAQSTLPPVWIPPSAVSSPTATSQVWLPLRGRSQQEDEQFYGLQKAYGFVSQVRWFTEGIGGGEDGVTNSISADVLSAVVKAVRLAVGTSVTSDTTPGTGTDPEATLQQLTRGGNLYVNGAYPLLRSPDWVADDPKDAKVRVAVFVLPQLSAVVPEFSVTPVTSTIYSLDAAAEATVDYSNDKGGIFVSGRSGPVFLSSAFDELAPGVSGRFWLTQWAAGVQVLGVRVSLQGLLGRPSQLGAERSVRLVFQLVP